MLEQIHGAGGFPEERTQCWFVTAEKTSVTRHKDSRIQIRRSFQEQYVSKVG